MPARKRHATVTKKSPERATKRKRPEVIDLEEDEEESLEAILALIQEQEQNEALAKQLNDQLNGGPSQPSGSGSQSVPNELSGDVMTVDDEDDEALARRLAEEWAQEEEMQVEDEPLIQVEEPTRATRSMAKGKKKQTAPVPSEGSSTTLSCPGSPTENELHSSAQDELLMCRDAFVQTRKCTKCGSDVVSPRGFVTYSTQTPPPSLLSLLHASCPSCKTSHCRGCFSAVACPPSCRGNPKDATCPVITCCAEVRAIALFEALGGFDRVYLGEQATGEQRAKEAAQKRATAKRQVAIGSAGPGGTGYGTGHSGGGLHSPFGYWGAVGSGEYYHEDGELIQTPAYTRGRGRGRGWGGRGRGCAPPAMHTASSSHTDAMAAHWDQILVRALTTVTSFLPAPYADDAQTYDMLPHGSIPSLILMSKLPELMGSLLRNDSITDWTARSDVYSAMLGLLRRFADCELTMQVLIGQSWEVKKSCGIEEWMWQDGDIVYEKTDSGQPAIATPIYSHFKKLTRQCEAFLAGASQMLEGDNGQDAGEEMEKIVQATSLCGDMLAARDDIDRAMTIMGKDPATIAEGTPIPATEPMTSGKKGKGKGKGKERHPDIDMERAYRQRCEQLAFQYVDSPNIQNGGFHYSQSVTQTASATRNPKDRIHLIKELAVMATSLPPGIWVRVDEVRNDIIKVMIAGPEGTPYSGGLFEFDCFIPLEYPNKPPLMNLCTTGGGRVRFNPNLYNNGKVCLSLLGTWAGSPEEMWNPSKSTLLQVLVSIQSMILIDLPYFNEPGYGNANPNHEGSKKYNKDTSLQATRWAIVEWLKQEHKDGIWGDVIASHFTIRETKIRTCIQEWAKKDGRIRKYAMNSTLNGERSHMHLGMMGHNVPKEEVPATGMDLLKAFEEGMEVVKTWAQREE